MEKQIEIKSLKIKNFGCIQDLELKLTPLHAVIGPNDSGKSTLLRSIRTIMQLMNGNFSGSFGNCSPFEPGSNQNAFISIDGRVTTASLHYEIQFVDDSNIKERWYVVGKKIQPKPASTYERMIWAPNNKIIGELFEKLLRRVMPHMIRLDPDSLRRPGGLIPSSQPINLQENGIGLVSVLDALISRNLEGYLSIREQFKKLFPTVIDLNYQNISNIQKKLGIKLKNGNQVFSDFLSEGMLYYLAYAVQQYLEPASILLIEEPENGLHPSRIKQIMTIIRELSKTTQVLIATHSPLVINEMEPEEVTVLWRDDDKGSQAMPMTETANFKDRSQVYALGELWLSYADGINEQELRTGKE